MGDTFARSLGDIELCSFALSTLAKICIKHIRSEKWNIVPWGEVD